MRILYIHQYFCTRQGRTGTRSYEFSKYLVAQGHQVTMITGASQHSDVRLEPGQNMARRCIDGIDVVAVAVDYSSHMGALRRVQSFLRFMLHSTWIACREPRHDVIVATSTPLTVAVPGMCASFLRRTPLVFEVRDLWPEAPIQLGVLRNRFLVVALRAFERLVYRRSKHVIALSPGMRDGIIAAGGRSSQVTVIPNCSDVDLFTPGPADPTIVARYGLQDALVVTHAGGMGPMNGLDVLIDAAQHLHQSGAHEIKILLVGDGRCEPALRQSVQARDLPNVVFAGSVPRTDVAALLRASHICLMLVEDVPVLATGSPNKLFDAFAAGRPVIINTGGWLKALVEGAGVGLVAEPASGRSLADAILRLARDAPARREMGVRARTLAEGQFDRRLLARDFETVLAAACGKPLLRRSSSGSTAETAAHLVEVELTAANR